MTVKSVCLINLSITGHCKSPPNHELISDILNHMSCHDILHDLIKPKHIAINDSHVDPQQTLLQGSTIYAFSASFRIRNGYSDELPYADLQPEEHLVTEQYRVKVLGYIRMGPIADWAKPTTGWR